MSAELPLSFIAQPLIDPIIGSVISKICGQFTVSQMMFYCPASTRNIIVLFFNL